MVVRRKSKVLPPPPECPLKVCMSFIEGAWTPNIIWYLSQNPRRFSELKEDLSGISAKVLTTRLKKMEMDGIVKRAVIQSSPPTVEYSLTSLGQELKPILETILKVGHRLKKIKKI